MTPPRGGVDLVVLGKGKASPLRMFALASRKAPALGEMHVGTSTRKKGDDPRLPKVALKARNSAPSSPLAPVSSVTLVETSTAVVGAPTAQAAVAALAKEGRTTRRRERARVTRSLLRRLPPSLLYLSLTPQKSFLATSPSRLRMITGQSRTIGLGYSILVASTISLPVGLCPRTFRIALSRPPCLLRCPPPTTLWMAVGLSDNR